MYCTSAYSTFPNLSRGPLPSVSVHEVGPTACVNVWRGLELGSLEGSSGRVLDVERNTCSILYTDYILYMVWVLYMSQLGFSPNKVPLTAIACDSSSACHPSCALAFFHLFSSLCRLSIPVWMCLHPGSSEFCPGLRGGHVLPGHFSLKIHIFVYFTCFLLFVRGFGFICILHE